MPDAQLSAQLRSPRAASVAPESRAARAEFLSIAATMLIVFIAAFGVMYWQRRADGGMDFGADPVQQPDAAGRPSGPNPSIARPAPPPRPVAVIENAAKAPAARASPQTADPPIPVTVSFMQYNQPPDDGDPEKTSTIFVGRVWNRSAAPVAVDVVRASAGGQSTAQVHLIIDAHRVKAFGQKDDGVELHPGDTVTLRSDHFADLVLQVH